MVIEHQCKKEILDKTGAKAGGKEMIKNYQGAVTAIMAGLSEEQLEEAKKTAIEWSLLQTSRLSTLTRKLLV